MLHLKYMKYLSEDKTSCDKGATAQLPDLHERTGIIGGNTRVIMLHLRIGTGIILQYNLGYESGGRLACSGAIEKEVAVAA